MGLFLKDLLKNNMMKLNYLLVLLLLLTHSLIGQEIVRSTISASGASSSISSGDNQYIIQQSIGQQSIIGTSQTSTAIVRQGFIQPPIEIISLAEEDNSLDAVVYPNPFQNVVHVRFNEEIEGPVTILLYDVLGRIVHNETQTVNNSNTSINLDGLSSTQYLLSITSNNKEFKTSLLKK